MRTRQDAASDLDVIGVIHAISIDDDPLVRQMILANNMTQGTIRDQRVNCMVPLEISVLNVGYIQDGHIHQTLPPRPPLSLDPVLLCDADGRPLHGAAGLPAAGAQCQRCASGATAGGGAEVRGGGSGRPSGVLSWWKRGVCWPGC